MRLMYKFPSRSRPEKFFATVDNIIALARHDNYFISATLDVDDPSMNTPDVIRKINSYKQIKPTYGRSVSKIYAVNRSVPDEVWDAAIVVSDDMQFTLIGFDLLIIEDLKKGDVVHYEDGYAHGQILSMPVMTRKYYDRFLYFYHPSYQSLFCDEEAIHVARALGALYESPHQIVKHNHPSNTGKGMDDQYKRTESFWSIDKRVYERRKAKNFDLP